MTPDGARFGKKMIKFKDNTEMKVCRLKKLLCLAGLGLDDSFELKAKHLAAVIDQNGRLCMHYVTSTVTLTFILGQKSLQALLWHEGRKFQSYICCADYNNMSTTIALI